MPPQTLPSTRPPLDRITVDQRRLLPSTFHYTGTSAMSGAPYSTGTPTMRGSVAQHDSSAVSTAAEKIATTSLPPTSAQPSYQPAVPSQAQLPNISSPNQPVSSQFMTHNFPVATPGLPPAMQYTTAPRPPVSSQYCGLPNVSSVTATGVQSYPAAPVISAGGNPTGTSESLAVAHPPDNAQQQPVVPQAEDSGVQAPQRTFTPIRMQADLSGNVASVTNTTIAKPSVVHPQQRLVIFFSKHFQLSFGIFFFSSAV